MTDEAQEPTQGLEQRRRELEQSGTFIGAVTEEFTYRKGQSLQLRAAPQVVHSVSDRDGSEFEFEQAAADELTVGLPVARRWTDAEVAAIKAAELAGVPHNLEPQRSRGPLVDGEPLVVIYRPAPLTVEE